MGEGVRGLGNRETTMKNSSTLTVPQGQVDSLMQEVADDAG